MPYFKRRSLRLPDYDYSQAGFYFVTLCIKEHRCLLGRVENSVMQLSPAGKMIEETFLSIPVINAGINVDAYVVMPNHFHGILCLSGEQKIGISEIVQRFKTFTTHQYIQGVRQCHWPSFENMLWQRNYYEHVIRNEQDYLRIYEYIENNPAKWELDRFYRE